MHTLSAPGSSIRKANAAARPITAIATSITAFVGRALRGPVGEPQSLGSFAEFEQRFGGLWPDSALGFAVRDFFANGGTSALVLRLVHGAVAGASPALGDNAPLEEGDLVGASHQAARSGLYALLRADLFNLLCIPPYLPNGEDMLDGGVDSAVIDAAARLCEQRRAMLLIDPPLSWTSAAAAAEGLSAVGSGSPNAAVFFPRLVQPLAHRKGQMGALAPCGAIAGLFARTDRQRGVWKAPAGVDASLSAVASMSVPLNDAQNGALNRLGINCLRRMPVVGSIVWGARTLQGGEHTASDWKFIPVRRTALFIEESLVRGTRWVAAEANAEPLWGQLRLNVCAFMHSLFLQGAFQGSTPQEAYFVRCDRAGMSGDDLARGVVRVEVGFAPFNRYEFVTLSIRLRCGASD